uniref:Eukaryotic translation initiation factor 4B n=1 Tax=Geospiza parvula TaxID=87175 RepID=A0A8U8BY28_GEOPR
MPLTAAKKKPKKGKTLTLTDFLAEDGGGGGTDDLEGEVSTTWHSNDDDVYRAPPIDRSILPTAPRAAHEPNIDRSRLPKSPPYTAFLGNLPYDVTEESIKDFFRGLNISAVRLPREPTNPERLKGFGYAEFEDIDSLFQALSLNEEVSPIPASKSTSQGLKGLQGPGEGFGHGPGVVGKGQMASSWKRGGSGGIWGGNSQPSTHFPLLFPVFRKQKDTSGCGRSSSG